MSHTIVQLKEALSQVTGPTPATPYEFVSKITDLITRIAFLTIIVGLSYRINGRFEWYHYEYWIAQWTVMLVCVPVIMFLWGSFMVQLTTIAVRLLFGSNGRSDKKSDSRIATVAKLGVLLLLAVVGYFFVAGIFAITLEVAYVEATG